MYYDVSNYLKQLPTMRVELTLLLATLFNVLITSGARADSRTQLDGYWQHPDDPVWIEVNVVNGTGVAMRNDDQPETVGFHVVRSLIEDDKAGSWKGEVFVPQLDSYKNVTITIPDEQTLRMTVKFGFIRRSVEWSRVDSIEAAVSE